MAYVSTQPWPAEHGLAVTFKAVLVTQILSLYPLEQTRFSSDQLMASQRNCLLLVSASGATAYL